MPRYNTVRERILWEYAKLVAASATGEARTQRYWRFATHTYGELRTGSMEPSGILRENKLLVASGQSCAYCDARDVLLHWEHIIPLSRGGPDTVDNLVLACAGCNLAKGARDPLSWYGKDRERIPRLVMGKLLKLLLDAHARAGTLDDRSYPAEDSQPRLGRLVLIFDDAAEP